MLHALPRLLKPLLPLLLLSLGLTCAHAQAGAIDEDLGESVVFVKNDALIPVSLEVTLFKPKEASGKLPVVIINHGKQSGNTVFQARYRPMPAVRSFLARGYAVVVPMRQGFSKSGGTIVGGTCDLANNGQAQADQVAPVVQWLSTQSWADTTRMAMFGQSHGGLTTLAYAQNPPSGVKVWVNFAGGLRFESGCDWQRSLITAFRQFGQRTRQKTLWFYGANDSYFPPAVIQPAFEAYRQAGGKAELIAYPAFENDAHDMFGAMTGLDIWLPKTLSYFAEAGLPTDIVYPQYQPVSMVRTILPETKFANIHDSQSVPFLNQAGRAGYVQFLTQPLPRAFAIAPNGAWGWASKGDTPPETRALAFCSKHATNCTLYVVDNAVVYAP